MKLLTGFVFALWLPAGLAQACEVIEENGSADSRLARRACEILYSVEGIEAVQAATPGLFYLHVNEGFHRALRSDKVGSEILTYKMLQALQGIVTDGSPAVFFMSGGRKVAKAGTAVFSRDPYLEIYD